MEGPHIEFNSEHEYSKTPEDGGFQDLLNKIEEKDIQLLIPLQEISKSESKKKIIRDALTFMGHDWPDIHNLKENLEARYLFGEMLSFWDTHSEEENKDNALKFSKKL